MRTLLIAILIAAEMQYDIFDVSTAPFIEQVGVGLMILTGISFSIVQDCCEMRPRELSSKEKEGK